MKVSEAKGKIKVGDWVRTNGNSDCSIIDYFEGEIGEIQADRFFVWQNEYRGATGLLSPSTRGYDYSWVVNFDNPFANIEILKRDGEVYDGTCSAIDEPKKETMYKLTPMQEHLLDEDLKILYKTGYIGSNLELTEKGKKALESIVFDTYKADLIRMAEEEIEEEKNEKIKSE